MNGTVKFFNNMKGFGFIAGEDGKEYFVHQSGLTEGTTINENDEVTFEVVEGDRGPKADKVALKGATASTEEAPAEEAPAEEAESTEEEKTE